MKFDHSFLHGLGARWLAAAVLGTGLALAPAQAQAQQTPAQFWEFDDAAGTTLPAAAPGFELGAQWTANITGVATNGSGALRIGSTATAVAYSYAPLNINDGGVFAATVRYTGWDIRNGAAIGNTRPTWNFGLRSAASTSSSLVADVQLRALATGVDVLVRDAQSDFTAQRFQLPSVLPGALTMTLKLDRVATPRTWTLSWAIDGGAAGEVSSNLAATSQSRAVSHVFVGLSGNMPTNGLNTAPAVDRIGVSCDEQVVTLLPPANGRPGKPSNLTNFLTGNPVQSTNAPAGGPALLLMGGGAEADPAFTARAYPVNNGGDIVVLRVSGGNGYQTYMHNRLVQQLPPELQTALQPNSVETLVVDTRSKANSDYVAQAVSRANIVWMAGGDQSQYISLWRDTALSAAVKLAYGRGAVIGGTSAGMVVSGQWMYDPGVQSAVTSAQAVADPFRANMIISTGLFDLPLGLNLVPEPHFANRDRMGRLVAFTARARANKRSALVFGVGLDEGTAMWIDKDGVGSFFRQTGTAGNGYVLREDRRATDLAQLLPGQPLIYRRLLRHKFTQPGETFDFRRSQTTVPASFVSAEGAVPVDPY